MTCVRVLFVFFFFSLFFFNDTATTEIYTLSLHDALPILLACISRIVRFRRSQSVVRKQIEWLAYAAAVVAAGSIVSALVQLRPQTETLDNYTNGIVSLALASIPVAMGIAILTRRLYDIDVIVNKTVVYLSLAAFITAVYIALVVGIGQAVGQQGKAGFGLSVLATAVVAVAFQPVRERVQ